MPTTFDESNVFTRLRNKAESQLKTRTTPAAGDWSMGVDTLRLLHRLSSDPDKAEDALKLLHELQVHQVELDLQNEEIATNERALAEELRLYRALYESAPAGYLVVDPEGAIVKGNLAAAELFGVDENELEGQRIDTFVSPQNRPRLLGLLQRVAQSGARDCCAAEVAEGKGARHVQFLATRSPEREQLLLVCCECENVE
ncbi:MAG: PAS domain S-box protein [Pseudomonadota bacterium]